MEKLTTTKIVILSLEEIVCINHSHSLEEDIKKLPSRFWQFILKKGNKNVSVFKKRGVCQRNNGNPRASTQFRDSYAPQKKGFFL